MKTTPFIPVAASLLALFCEAHGLQLKQKTTRALRENASWGCGNGSFDFFKFMCVCEPGWGGSKCNIKDETPLIFGETDNDCDDPSLNLSCDWYKRCLAKHLPNCREDEKEYAVNYGFKFCSLFTEQASTFSEKGKVWIESTKLCLQRELVKTMDKPTTNCTLIRADAFDSHPNCYVQPDPDDPKLGICNLVHTSPMDVYNILRITRSALFTRESAKQIAETAFKCAGKWIG